MATSRILRAGAVLAVAITAVAIELPASAAPDAKQRAARLFEDASKALSDKRYDEACRMLEESDRLERAVGTEYNLAQCLELQGKIESARRTFEQVAELARQSGKDNIAERAAERARVLASAVPRLVLRLPAGVTDASVECDGKALSSAEIGAPIALDPGVHTIRAVARDRAPFDGTVTLVKGRTTELAVGMPPSGTASGPPPAPGPSGASGAEKPSGSATSIPLRPIALATAGVGVVALGVAGFFALRSLSARDDSGCDGARCPDQASADRLRDAGTKADVATICTIAGAALTAGGVALFFFAPRGESASARHPATRVTLGGRGVALEGAF